MFHIDKFKKLGFISFAFQKLGTKTICDQSCHSFLQDPITHNRLEHFVSDLTIQFMLTAWNRQDHLSPPFHCLGQSEICCCIAGMKCHHHVHRRNAFVPCNISLVKMQLVITIRSGQFTAMPYHIFLKIQPGRISLINSRKRLICLNLSYLEATIFPSFVITPRSTRNGAAVPSLRMYCFTRL